MDHGECTAVNERQNCNQIEFLNRKCTLNKCSEYNIKNGKGDLNEVSEAAEQLINSMVDSVQTADGQRDSYCDSPTE